MGGCSAARLLPVAEAVWLYGISSGQVGRVILFFIWFCLRVQWGENIIVSRTVSEFFPYLWDTGIVLSM